MQSDRHSVFTDYGKNTTESYDRQATGCRGFCGEGAVYALQPAVTSRDSPVIAHGIEHARLVVIPLGSAHNCSFLQSGAMVVSLVAYA